MSYGTNAATGLLPTRYLNGAPWTGGTSNYLIVSGYSTAIFKGDPVTLGTDGTIKIGVAGSAILGVFWGCIYTLPSGISPVTQSNYWPASTVTANAISATALIVDGPDIVYNIQETNASAVAGTPLTQVAVGQNFNFVVGSGTTATGISTTSLNNASTPTTATNNLKIVAFDPNISNPAIGTAFQNWDVIINNHLFKGGTGTAGHA